MCVYLVGLVHGDEGGDHGLPQGVLVVPEAVRLHVGVRRHKELHKKEKDVKRSCGRYHHHFLDDQFDFRLLKAKF